MDKRKVEGRKKGERRWGKGKEEGGRKRENEEKMEGTDGRQSEEKS